MASAPMTAQAPQPTPPAGSVRGGRRTLILLALITLAPVVASYSIYYFFPPDRRANYGELLPTRPAPPVAGVAADGSTLALHSLAGKWVLAVAAPADCGAECRKALYAMRQARTIQGRERNRLAMVWFVVGESAIDPTLLAEHPDLVVLRGDAATWARLEVGPERMILLDPLSNRVLAFPRDPDIKAMAKDLSRLLKASRIG